MANKYELTDEKIKWGNHILYRIKAIRDFGTIKNGRLGGFIESEDNLSQEGNAWVYENAYVYGNARVSGNAQIYGNARVYENAQVSGYAQVYENARVYENAQVYGDAHVYENAKVYGNARVNEHTWVYGNAWVYGDAKVSGFAQIFGNVQVFGDAKINKTSDYMVFKNFWSSGRYFTYTRSNKMWSVGCFYGTGDQLIKKAYRDSEISGRNYERIVRYVEEVEEKEF